MQYSDYKSSSFPMCGDFGFIFPVTKYSYQNGESFKKQLLFTFVWVLSSYSGKQKK